MTAVINNRLVIFLTFLVLALALGIVALLTSLLQGQLNPTLKIGLSLRPDKSGLVGLIEAPASRP